jgi:para-aminobenzoate synthetase / 4-amino-4-deoxychorismate lyase
VEPRIVTAMLEARFDDLTGATSSFRLVGPIGVLEATRAGEVVSVLEAAEAAAGRGIWVAGFVSYEAAPGLDPALVVRARGADDAFAALPLAWFAMFERAEETTLPVSRDEGVPGAPDGTWMPTTPRERFESAVDEIHRLIAAGETYQVNHTMRLRSRVEGDPRGLYRDLCYAQRGAYSAYLDLGRYRVLSASPELFFERRSGSIVTRPMKGTAPRGRWPEEDHAAAERLLASAKDRAENAMIVDLLRNDLGRISRAGSVTWADAFQVERYETVWQLTTTVSAELETGIGLAEIFRGLFQRIGHGCAEGPDDGDHP